LVSTVEAEHIGAGAPEHQVIATAAHQHVRVKATDQDVVATLAFEEAAHGTEQISDEQIVAVVTCDEIVRRDSDVGAAVPIGGKGKNVSGAIGASIELQ